MRTFGLSCALIACGGSHGADLDARDGNATDAVSPSIATVRIHYPAGAHSITIRGGGAGLSWTAGTPTNTTGEIFSYSITGMTEPIEWKPLLDDVTWARGPNYRVSPGTTTDVWPHFVATTGHVVTSIVAFHSTILGNDRAIYAYLPASYDENLDATYPVVYMHDGQNLWGQLASTWNVDTAFDRAAEHGACSSANVTGWGAQPLGATPTLCTGDADCGPGGSCATFPEAIVIGVANTASRIYEYTPTTDPGTPGGGGADQYLSMLVNELKPAIDARLRTRPDAANTALIGSSLGGLVTAYAGVVHADVFSRVGELSPSTWWSSDVIITDVAGTTVVRPAVVYIDSGQGSVDDEADTDQLAQAYTVLGYGAANFRHVIQPGAQHAEMYWAERLPGALQLLLGAR